MPDPELSAACGFAMDPAQRAEVLTVWFSLSPRLMREKALDDFPPQKKSSKMFLECFEIFSLIASLDELLVYGNRLISIGLITLGL